MKAPELTPNEIDQAKSAINRVLSFFKADTLGSIRSSVSGHHRGRPLLEVDAKRFRLDSTPHLYTWGWAAPLVREYMQQELAAWETAYLKEEQKVAQNST